MTDVILESEKVPTPAKPLRYQCAVVTQREISTLRHVPPWRVKRTPFHSGVTVNLTKARVRILELFSDLCWNA